MKTRILFFAMLLGWLISFAGTAQIVNYNASGLLPGPDYTYRCDLDGGRVTLYNNDSKYVYANLSRKDGKPVGDEYLLGLVNTTALLDVYAIQNIIEGVFTPAELASFKQGMMATLIFDSTMGHVTEVHFSFLKGTGYDLIPVNKYRQIELKLKEKIVTQITDVGKRLTFCMAGFPFKPYRAR